jgi:hypothetical protein
MTRIVGADGGTRQQPGARACGRAQAGIAGGRAQHGAKHRAADGAAHGAAGLLIPCGFAGRDVTGARRRIPAAEDVAIRHIAIALRGLRRRA